MDVRAACICSAVLILLGCNSTQSQQKPSSDNDFYAKQKAQKQQYEQLDPLDYSNLSKRAEDKQLTIVQANLLGRWKCSEAVGQLTDQAFGSDGWYQLEADGNYRQQLRFDHYSTMYGHIPLSFTIVGRWTMTDQLLRFSPERFENNQNHPEPWEETHVLPPRAQQQLKKTILNPWSETVTQLSQQAITFIDNNGEASLCKRSKAS